MINIQRVNNYLYYQSRMGNHSRIEDQLLLFLKSYEFKIGKVEVGLLLVTSIETFAKTKNKDILKLLGASLLQLERVDLNPVLENSIYLQNSLGLKEQLALMKFLIRFLFQGTTSVWLIGAFIRDYLELVFESKSPKKLQDLIAALEVRIPAFIS